MRPSSRPDGCDEATGGQVDPRWRRGGSVAVLAPQHGRAPSAIDRMINEMRARRILGQELEYIYDACFDAPEAAGTILAPTPAGGIRQAAARAIAPPGLHPYLSRMYDAPLLSREQEKHLFRKMNYLKYRASKLRDSLDPARAEAAELDEIGRLQEEALEVKNQIIRANLRLVVSIARTREGTSDSFFERVSDGNMSLIRAVEKFDFARGSRFSTYASWAIMRNFARGLSQERSRRSRFVTGHQETFNAAADHRSDEHERESDHRRDQDAVHDLLGKLSDRERRILVGRYGIGDASALTLEQLGEELGITKQRVRQIASRAQEKLSRFARNAIG